MTGNDLGTATDDHLMDIAPDPDFLVAVGDGHRVVVAPVTHQGQGVDPRALLVTGATEGVDHVRYLVRLAELELIDRERRRR